MEGYGGIHVFCHMESERLNMSCVFGRHSSLSTLDSPGGASNAATVVCQPMAASQSWAELAAKARESCQQALQAVGTPSPMTPSRSPRMDLSPRIYQSTSHGFDASSPPPTARVEHRIIAEPKLPATRAASPMTRPLPAVFAFKAYKA